MSHTLKIGWASRDVSTTGKVNIPGQFYARISEGVLDPVTITVLVLDDGTDYTVFVSGDMVGVCPELVIDFRKKIAERAFGVDPLKVAFSITHTHAGAAHYKEFPMDKDGVCSIGYLEAAKAMGVESADIYRDFLSTSIADAVEEAWKNRKAGGIAWGYGYAVVGHSRRVVYMDDTSKRPSSMPNPGGTNQKKG